MSMPAAESSHGNVAEFMNQDRYKYAADPQGEKAEAILQILQAQKKGEEPEAGVYPDRRAEQSKTQIEWCRVWLEHGTAFLTLACASGSKNLIFDLQFASGKSKLFFMDWNRYRAEFPVTRKWAFLDHAAVAPLSGRAQKAMVAWAADLTENGHVNEWPCAAFAKI